MSSPRKFSEKIALHNQKQAEETAAFEQIMNEVSKVARPHIGGVHKSHHLQLAPAALGAYRGGSLPNVNQLNNSIDLQQPMMVGATTTFHVQKPVEVPNWQQPNCHTVVTHVHNQNALHSLEDIKTTGVSGRSGLVDRGYRPPRGAGTHRRHDTTPYTAPYLSPPSDTSWRRTNSDSALHTSAMNPGDPFQGPSSSSAQSSPRRDLLDTDTLKANAWDSKKQSAQNRPRSCEVPGINICPSEQNTSEVATSAPIPISNNTGSLPDLTNLHIPSPLPTPLDPEDQTYNHGGSTGNLSSSMPQTLGVTTTNHTAGAGAVSPTHSPQISPQISPQLQRRTVSNPGSPIAGAAADQRRQQYSPQLQKRPMSNPSSPIAMTSNQWQQQQQQQQHSPQVGLIQQQQQQYRDNHQSLVNTSCASPTSPASNPSYSPVASPGVPVGSPGSPATFTDAYYMQQQQETNALQQQFQEINMMQDPTAVVSQPGLQYHPGAFYSSQAYMLEGHDLQVQPNKPPPAYPNIPILTTQAQNPTMGIPDIIFTGVGESPPRQDLPKEISSAMAGVDSFDSDPFFPEPIKLDPLDIDTLHMLTDNDMVADQATEESFRLDRL